MRTAELGQYFSANVAVVSILLDKEKTAGNLITLG